MSEKYDRELASVRIFDLTNTLANLYGYARARGDSAAMERTIKLIKAIKDYNDSEGKEQR